MKYKIEHLETINNEILLASVVLLRMQISTIKVTSTIKHK